MYNFDKSNIKLYAMDADNVIMFSTHENLQHLQKFWRWKISILSIFFSPEVHHPRTRKWYIYDMRIFSMTKKTYLKMLTTLHKFIHTS